MSIINKKTIVLLLVAAGGYYAYTRYLGHGGWGGAPGGAPPVSVAEVIEKSIRPWHDFSGRLTAVDQVEIRPRVSGTIMKVHFEDGAMVKRGDPLFTIDPRPYEAALQAAQARAVMMDAEMQRAKTLRGDKAIAQRDFDQRRNDAEVARAELTRAKLDLDYTHITSPITGRVGRAEITEGNLVETNAGAPVLTTVVSISPIYADFEIDEDTYLEYVQAKATSKEASPAIPVTLQLTGETGPGHAGHIESFDNRLSSATGTIRVRAMFDNADGMLVPGLFARIQIGAPAQTDSLLITDRAVGTDQNKKFVIVVGAENKTERREIKLGPLADGLRVVKEGLKPGEKIIVSGMQRVMMPGQPVTPEMVPMDGSAAPAAGGTPQADGGAPQVDGGRMTDDKKKEVAHE